VISRAIIEKCRTERGMNQYHFAGGGSDRATQPPPLGCVIRDASLQEISDV
jgi:hypothetical protein